MNEVRTNYSFVKTRTPATAAASEHLLDRITQLEQQIERFMNIFRRAYIQDMRAREQLALQIKTGDVRQVIEGYMVESRRSSIQVVNVLSRELGIETKKKRVQHKLRQVANSRK